MTASPTDPNAQPALSGDEEYSAYLEYNKVLRSWFVAFGIGGPALFLINPQIGNKLAGTGHFKYISGLFLAGAAFQVLGALINKFDNWYVYRGANDLDYQRKKRFKASKWLIEQFWIDIGLDVATAVAFGLATLYLFTLLG